jgi:cellulose synthase/poly-beta-1,6-N-acetylglucosamine synthase-like glycosyltransferase
MTLLFWLLLLLVFYTYLGYGILLTLLVKVKEMFIPSASTPEPEEWPEVTLVIAAYNEKEILESKIENSKALDYPEDKRRILFVTDGSNDGSEIFLQDFQGIEVLHENKRGGKVGALNRAMKFVDTPITVLCDANAMLSKNALKSLVQPFMNPKIGAVSGEKRVVAVGENAADQEGLYWKYESYLKAMDARFYSLVGTAGELYAIRTDLYEEVAPNVILDDFFISMRICLKGYRVDYQSEAKAAEAPSADVGEEFKRKVRIAAGGVQAVMSFPQLLNFLKRPALSFQYISHRVLRWTLTPWAMILLLIVNLFLLDDALYQMLALGQLLFYGAAILGYFTQSRPIKGVSIAFYFCMMNYAVLKGQFKHFKGGQSAIWERSKRAA